MQFSSLADEEGYFFDLERITNPHDYQRAKRATYTCPSYIPINNLQPWEAHARELAQQGVTTFTEAYPFRPDLNQRVFLAPRVDITQLEVDAIVNSTTFLQTNARVGVDRAVRQAAGPLLDRELDNLASSAPGLVLRTKGYRLPAKYVLHAYSPNSETDLEMCYTSCFRAAKGDIQSIAFCCLGTGRMGLPAEKAAHIALNAARKCLEENNILRVIFCPFTETDVTVYERMMPQYFPIAAKTPVVAPLVTTPPDVVRAQVENITAQCIVCPLVKNAKTGELQGELLKAVLRLCPEVKSSLQQEVRFGECIVKEVSPRNVISQSNKWRYICFVRCPMQPYHGDFAQGLKQCYENVFKCVSSLNPPVTTLALPCLAGGKSSSGNATLMEGAVEVLTEQVLLFSAAMHHHIQSTIFCKDVTTESRIRNSLQRKVGSTAGGVRFTGDRRSPLGPDTGPVRSRTEAVIGGPATECVRYTTESLWANTDAGVRATTWDGFDPNRDEQGHSTGYVPDARDVRGQAGYARDTAGSVPDTNRDLQGLPTGYVPDARDVRGQAGYARDVTPCTTSSQINIKVVTCNVLYEPYYRQHCKSADVMQGSERSAVMQAFFHRLLSTDLPDFVALQEYNDREMAFLSVFRNYGLVATQATTDTCAILYRNDRFAPVGRPTYHLFNIGTPTTKCCLLQLFEAVENSSMRVGIASTHVPFSVDPVARDVFFTTLSKQFSFLHGRYIVCGDFNTEISPVGSASFPASRWRDAISGKPTARVASGVKKLDYVLYTPATGVTLNGDCVVYPANVGSSCLPHAPGETISRTTESYFSDHAVVICNFTLQ
eukprot:PhF_6_TR36051/c0_g1_i3/m.52306